MEDKRIYIYGDYFLIIAEIVVLIKACISNDINFIKISFVLTLIILLFKIVENVMLRIKLSDKGEGNE